MKLYIVSVLIGSVAVASTEKTEKMANEWISGTSVGKYAKPGAPIDMTYTSQNVEAGESAEVNIDLSTSLQTGVMRISINIGKALTAEQEIENKVFFPLDKTNNRYPLKFYVSAEEDGVYYIKLLITIEGKGSRAFAVPVFIGKGRAKKSKSPFVKKSASGENISVSKAVERIIK